MITTDEISKIRQQLVSKQVKQGKITTDAIANIRKQMQPVEPVTQPVQQVTQPVQTAQQVQPQVTNHAQKAQQGYTQAKDKLHETEVKATPMTDKINSGASLTPEEVIQLAKEQGKITNEEAQYQNKLAQARKTPTVNNYANKANYENVPVKSTQKEQGKKDAEKVNVTSENAADEYIKARANLQQAKANNDTREIAKNEAIVEKSKQAYNGEKPNIDITSLGKQLNGLEADLDKIQSDYNLTTDIELKNRLADDYNKTLENYNAKRKIYNNAVTYDEIKNNNMANDIAESTYLGLAGGTHRMGEGAYALGSRLSNANADQINADELLRYNNNEANWTDTVQDIGNALGKLNLQQLPVNLANRLLGNEKQTANSAYTQLQRVALLNPDNIGIQRLYRDITNHTYKGTAEDLRNELDKIQKELYQNYRDVTGADYVLGKEREQLAHNENVYGELAAIPNAFNTTANMIPSMALAPVGGENVSLAAMAVGAGGGALDEALEAGARYNQAFDYGVLSGATEFGTEKLFGSGIQRAIGINGTIDPSELANKFADSLGIKNRIGRAVLQTMGDVTGESLEEMISETLNPLWKYATYDQNAFNEFNPEQIIKAGIDAIPSTLLMEGMGAAGTSVKVDLIANGVVKSINQSKDLSPIVKNQLINEVREAAKDVKLGLQEEEYIGTRANEKLENLTASSNDMKARIPQGYTLPQSTIDILAYTENNRPGLNIAFDTNIQGNGTFVENPDGTRTITLNPNSKRAVEFTLTHELGHDLKGTGEYTQLQNLLTDYAKGKPGYQEALNQLDKTYKESGASYNLQDEATNDMLGQAIGEQEFYNRLAENPTLFNKVTNGLKNILGNKESKLKNKVEKLTKNALQQEYKGNKQGVQNSLQEYPAKVSDIKNITRYIANAMENETDKTWKARLRDAYFANAEILYRKHKSPLQEKRRILQQYLDYKNGVQYSLSESSNKNSFLNLYESNIPQEIAELNLKENEEYSKDYPKEKITETLEELKSKLNNLDEETDEGFYEADDIKKKIKALENGYDNAYEYNMNWLINTFNDDYKNYPEYYQNKYQRQIEESKKAEAKQKQLEEDIKNASVFKRNQYYVVTKANPMFDDYHKGIRTPADIVTFEEAIQNAEDDGVFAWGDYSLEDAERDLKRNLVRIYSSYPIKPGVFVTPSFVQAQEYAGGEGHKVYSKLVAPDKVAWIDGDEGQYSGTVSKTKEEQYSKQNASWQDFLDKNLNLAKGTKTQFEGLPSNEELAKAENKGVNAILKDLNLPSNEELQQAETKSIENDAKALNLVSEEEYLKAPKNTYDDEQFDYVEHDKKLQKQIEKQVLDAIGNNFNKDALLQRLEKAREEADKKSNIDAKTGADEDQVTVNRRVRTFLEDFIHEIKQGYDIRDSTTYRGLLGEDVYKEDITAVYPPLNKITTNKKLEDMRNFKEVGNKKVNAYQYENPEVKPFFQYEAGILLDDLNNATKGERFWQTGNGVGDGYGAESYYKVTGQKRDVVQDIADLLDGNYGVKLSYNDIRKGLEAIIEDNGAENIAAAKRIEMVLDKRLREGYKDSYGYYHEPGENYNKFLKGEEYVAPDEYDLKQLQDTYDKKDDTLFSLSDEETKEINDYIGKLNQDTTIDENFKEQVLNKFDNLNTYKQFEDIKKEVQDYKDRTYKGISGLVDIANMKEEDVKQQPMQYTQKVDKNTSNQRKFFENAETSPIIAEQTKNRVNATTYEQKANSKTLEEVRQKLDERGNDLVDEWKTKSKNFTDKDVALGAILIERYQQNGDWESAARAVEKLADIGTEAGRAVQMYSIFQRLSPETMAIYQQKALDKAFEDMKKNKTGKWVEANKDKFKLTAEDTQFIYDQVEKASQAIDEETKQRELSKIENRINGKLPPNSGDAIKTLRRIAMLFNPKTQVRNVVGNALIMPVNDVADLVGTAIDKIISNKTNVRTTSTPNLVTKAKGFGKGVKDAITDYKTGTRTTATGSKYEFEFGAKPFNENTNSKARNAINHKLNGINDLLSAVMSGGDRPFYEAAYKNSLEGQMKANKVSEPTQEMIDIAVNEALQRTWNDNNKYTETVLKIRRAMNTANINGFGLGDLIIPFAKTPANLTKAMVEYSPAGFIESVLDFNDMRKAISRGEMTPQQQKKFVSSMSKAITGTMLYLIAGTLAKSGIITGSADDDKDVRSFEQNVMGIQPYSVRIGDKTYTYSWANPINFPLAVMADNYKMSKENASLWDRLSNGFKVAGESLVDNSFLSGIKELFGSDSISEGLVKSVESFPESLVPTFLSQIASLGDDKQRQTYEYQNELGTVGNRIKNKIPGARNTLEPQVNAFGEEIENQNTAFNAFLNPANVREAKTTETQNALYDLYQETKDKTIFPDVAPSYTNTGDGEKMNLSSKDKVTYSKASGQYITDVYGGLFNSDAFDTFKTTSNNNEGKVNILQKVREDANLKGREAIGAITEDNSDKLSKLNERLKKLDDAGIPYEDYYIMWYYVNNGEDKKNNTKKIGIGEVIRNLDHDISSKQKDVLYGIFDIGKGSK